MALQFLQSISKALGKTRKNIQNKIHTLFHSGINEDTIDELEELLYQADLGVEIASDLTEKVRQLWEKNPKVTTDELLTFIKEDLAKKLPKEPDPINWQTEGPTVILIVGVNGNGKTTTIARLAKKFSDQGKSTLVAAADTFRAAAVDQLTTWAERLQIPIVKGQTKADPSAVVFDATTAAVSRSSDVLLIDTAGRLQTKSDLMNELEKMRRSANKALAGAPHETWLILDAATGQNAIDQAKVFSSYVPLTGLILTKVDGTAKGGMAIPICEQLNIPIRFLGTGEGAKDIEIFDPQSYVEGLL